MKRWGSSLGLEWLKEGGRAFSKGWVLKKVKG